MGRTYVGELVLDIYSICANILTYLFFGGRRNEVEISSTHQEICE